MTEDTYCIIMAGGVGSRFWPISTSETPKQFLDVLGVGKTLLQQTLERFLPICPLENFIVITSAEHKTLVIEQLPMLGENQILTEPMRKNTATCIAYSNAIIKRKNTNATIIVSPSDHLILNENMFVADIEKGIEFVRRNDALLTLGVKPSRPETAYGYIQIEIDKLEAGLVSKVKTFTEKPNQELANVFFESGDFYWNSGVFIWTLSSIEAAYKKHLPHTYEVFAKFQEADSANTVKTLSEIYSVSKNISIDYGIMEKADNVYVQTVKFAWSDLGTWKSLYDSTEKDTNNNSILSGNLLLYKTKDCLISLPKDHIGIIQGLNDYIVIQSDKALLICSKDNEQQIRQFTNDLKTKFDIDE